ncbi:MAG: glycosyltransferase [Fimbriimonadaceae bacterium]|nr:glycosyltransferase [Fimbriimonadaceae bacterium]
MKKVAFLVPKLAAGGAERITLYLADALAKAGYEVTIVSMHSGGDLVKQVPPGVSLVSLNCNRPAAAILPMLRFVIQHKPHVVVSALDSANILNALVKRIWPRFRAVLAIHSTPSRVYNQSEPAVNTRAERMRTALLRADQIVSVSEASREDAAHFFRIPLERFRLIYNPCIPGNVDELVNDRPDSVPKEPYAVFVGRLIPDKQVDGLLRIWTTMRDKPLVIVGDGPEREQLMQLVLELQLDSCVHFAGFQTNPFPWLQRARLAILCSRREGLPTVLAEALYLGTPIVAFDCPSGPREMLRGGQYGALVPPDDWEALRSAVERTWSIPPPAVPAEAWAPYRTEQAVAEYIKVIEDK